MFVKYVGTRWYFCILIFVFLFVLILWMYIIYEIYKVYITKRRYCTYNRKEQKSECRKEIKRRNRRLHWLIAFALLVLCLIAYLEMERSKYDLKREYAWTIEERNNGRELYFSVIERKMSKEMSWYEKALHMEWYDNIEGDIGEDVLGLYEEKVDDIFSSLPIRENRIGEIVDLDSDFEERKRNFETLVNNEHKNLDSEQLWEGYEDGVEVCKVYETSENIFQTGVLAESAHENAYRSYQSRESDLMFVAGMVCQFERFLEFQNRDAGAGVEISAIEVCFRIEKALYRISVTFEEYDERTARHCALYGYSCSQYSVINTKIEDECYLKYLYNSGLNCLNLIQYIDKEVLCEELCQKELDRWTKLSEEDISMYKTEGKTWEEIIKVKERLEHYVKD